ncbi:MAG TPA: MarR family transcriptional regulator [Actinomycetota bacterium]|nr:MarR family transcriptional regulator [Actinomycetota bacterium]
MRSATTPRGDEDRIAVAWRELRRAGHALRAQVLPPGSPVADPAQVDVLEVVVHRPARMSDLAAALRVDPSTATRLVDRLVREGLVERVAVPGDARCVTARATPSGRRVWHEISRRRVRLMRRLLRDFSPRERAVFAELLERLVAGADRVRAEASAAGRGTS